MSRLGRLQLLEAGSADFDAEVGFAILTQCCCVRLARDFGSVVATGAVLRRMGCGRHMISPGRTTNIVGASILQVVTSIFEE